MITAFLITTLIVFSINLLFAIYALLINSQDGEVNGYGIALICVSLLMVSWNIYCLINI